MIASEVAGIRCRLVDVRLRRRFLAFKLEHENRAPGQEDDIYTSRFHGQLILQNSPIFPGLRICFDNFPHLVLQLRY